MKDTGDHKAAAVASSDARHIRRTAKADKGYASATHLRGANFFEPPRFPSTTPRYHQEQTFDS